MRHAKSGNNCSSCWTVTLLIWSFFSGWRLQWFSASVSHLLRFYWNLPGVTNSITTDWACFVTCGNKRLNAAVIQHCRIGCPSLKPTEPIAIAVASSSPPFWPCCWQTGDSPVWALLQGASFPTRTDNLLILALHHPLVLVMPGSTQLMGDVTHGLVGLRLVSCVTIGKTIRTGSVMVLKLQLCTTAWRRKRLQIVTLIFSNADVHQEPPVLHLGVLKSTSDLIALKSLVPATLGLRNGMLLHYQKGLIH